MKKAYKKDKKEIVRQWWYTSGLQKMIENAESRH
nr:MAG TPA: Flagellar M-ring protein, Flagellar motor motor, switch complex, MOTOR [Bacteriophage sp.]